MKITMTRDNTVTFAQMTPDTAEMLINIASDLVKGNAVLLYSPEYPDPISVPTEKLRGDLKKLVAADERYPGSLTPLVTLPEAIEAYAEYYDTKPMPTVFSTEATPFTHEDLWDHITEEN